jgi:hypothetical protein
MEEKSINREEIASAITDHWMEAKELCKELKSIRDEYLYLWFGTEEELDCTDKVTMKGQIYLLNVMIEQMEKE